LEREAGVPDEKIIEAHGSFANQSCIECKSSYPKELMLKAINEKSVPHCLQEGCGGLVKPDIVFFGEQLPSEFFANMDLPREADLCIVMGTSLSVAPFAHLPGLCGDSTPRVLINGEAVGGLGSRPDDVLMIGDCDTGVRKLAEACGWLEDLETMWAKTAPEKQPKTEKEKAKKSRDEKLQDEVEKLTKDIEEGLKLEQAQHKWVNEHVDNNFARVQNTRTESNDVQQKGMDNEAVVGGAALGGSQSEAPTKPVKKMDTSHLEFLNQHLDDKSTKFQAEENTQHQSLEQHLGSLATKFQTVSEMEETLRPMPETEVKAEIASVSKPEATIVDQGGHGLSHIFPHLSEKSSS
jgi:NAD-dependent histone deacetylase SIR2